MKTGIAIVTAVTLLSGIYGAATWTQDIAGISFVGTIVMSATFGAIVGTIIAAVTWLVQKVIK